MNREGENTEQRSERRVQKNRREKKNRADLLIIISNIFTN